MFLNTILDMFQKLLRPIYDRSFILQKMDWFIGISICAVLVFSLFAQSDMIGNFALCAILFTLIKYLTKQGEKIDLSNAEICLVIYFIFVLISVAGSSLFALSLKGFLKTVMYIGFYFSVVSYFKDNKDKIKYVFLLLIAGMVYESAVAFMQNIGAIEEISGWQDVSYLNPEEVMTRVYGTLKPLNPNLFGGYMLSVIPSVLTLPFIFKADNKINQRFNVILSLILCLFFVTALVLTGCRGSYIGFFAELLLLFVLVYLMLDKNKKQIFTAVSSAVSVLVCFIIFSITSLRSRILSIFAMRGDSSNSFRFNVYNSCIDMFKDNWLLGIGCGNQNFREIYGLYMKTGFDALSAYNIYLEIAVESGIFALISFIAFIAVNIYQGIKYVLTNKSYECIFVLAAILSLTGMLFHGFVDTVFFRPQIQFLFWIMVGIIRVSVQKQRV